MNKRLAILGVLLSTGGVAFVACSFPDVSFAPEGSIIGSEGGDTATSDGMTPDGTTVEGDGGPAVNPDVDPEGGAKDATTLSDASQRVDAEAGCCDCDGDHVKAEGGTCAFPVGDCDDGNKAVFAGQTFVDSVQWETTHAPIYDWDCDGVVTKQFVHSLAPCAMQLKALGCTQFQGGFNGDPACGTAGHYVISCAPDPAVLGLGCVETAFDMRHQGCH